MNLELLAIDTARFNQVDYIEQRVNNLPSPDRGFLKTALSYLYLDNGPINLPRDRLKIATSYLEPAELIVIRWLYTRTNGSERKNYGAASLRAARESRYRCKVCGFSDVRTLNLDHINGRDDKESFDCLCANCHTIKSRTVDWSGKKREEIL